jgi:hypothetical protein
LSKVVAAVEIALSEVVLECEIVVVDGGAREGGMVSLSKEMLECESVEGGAAGARETVLVVVKGAVL